MATQFTDYPAAPIQRSFSWTGIFAGTFLFLAIEATFGILGVAIFGSATSPIGAGAGGFHMGIGGSIWMIVLSIIALYFAGKLSARLAGASTRNLGMYAGLVTFGMCVFTSLLVAAMALSSTVAGSTGIGFAGPARIADILAAGGYWLFAALVLGLISAASGGIHGSASGRLRIAATSRTAPEEKRAA